MIWCRDHLKEKYKGKGLHLIIQKEHDEARFIARMYEQWIRNRNNGIKIGSYLSYYNYKCVAIYGYLAAGTLLYEEIMNDVEDCFAIDRDAWMIRERRILVYLPEDAPKEVDVVIVTALFDFHRIKEELQKKYSCPIVSLQEVIFDSEGIG